MRGRALCPSAWRQAVEQGLLVKVFFKERRASDQRTHRTTDTEQNQSDRRDKKRDFRPHEPPGVSHSDQKARQQESRRQNDFLTNITNKLQDILMGSTLTSADK